MAVVGAGAINSALFLEVLVLTSLFVLYKNQQKTFFNPSTTM